MILESKWDLFHVFSAMFGYIYLGYLILELISKGLN